MTDTSTPVPHYGYKCTYVHAAHLTLHDGQQPGPQYNVTWSTPHIGSGLKYSFGGKYRFPDMGNIPGPGNYSPPTPAQRHPGPAFSITSRRTPSRFAFKKED